MSLATRYLGLTLPHPLIVGAGPLTDDLDLVRELEDEGAAALVLRPLYEEEVTADQMSALFHAESHGDSFAEAGSYAPDPDLPPGPDEYLEHLRRVKSAVKIPVVASLNATTLEGWTYYARLMQEAGADAVEADLYHAASDAATSAADVERGMTDVVRALKATLRVPVAAKLSPLFTAFGHFCRQLDAAGVDGLVLFHRFHRVDLDVRELEVLRALEPSTPAELPLRLRGVACLAGRVRASLAVSGGVHGGLDVVKATMTGAHAVHIVSALFRHGPRRLREIRAELEAFLQENEWSSLDEMRGNMSFDRIPDPAAYERANFRRMTIQ
jgi:dihydroorotate dehydrogenase (fumarate)